MSRAAFVAIAVVALVQILNNRRLSGTIVDYARTHRTATKIISIISLMVILGGSYGVYALKKDSANGRLLMWKISSSVMVDNPAIGVGQGYWAGAYGDTQAEYFRTKERSEKETNIAGCPEYAFNEYLHIGAETGLLGLLLFIFLTGMALWQLFRARSPYAYGFMALLIFAFFSYPLSLLPIKILFVMFLAVAGACENRRRSHVTTVQKVVVGIIITVSAGTATLVAKPYIERVEATKDWQELRHWYSMEMYSDVLNDYQKLYPLLSDNPTFLFEYGRSLNMEGQYTESLDILIPAIKLSSDPMFYNIIGNNYKALGEYSKAAESYLKAHYIIPNRIYPLYLLGKMYSEIGDDRNARLYARMVVDMTPKIPSPATDDMQQEMKEILNAP